MIGLCRCTIMSHEKGKDCPYKQIYSKMPKYINGLRAFGEIGIITIGSNKIKTNLIIEEHQEYLQDIQTTIADILTGC